MAGHRGSYWTAEEDRRLLDLIRMNKSWVLISAALSRSVKSVRDRARHLERRARMESAAPDVDRKGFRVFFSQKHNFDAYIHYLASKPIQTKE